MIASRPPRLGNRSGTAGHLQGRGCEDDEIAGSNLEAGRIGIVAEWLGMARLFVSTLSERVCSSAMQIRVGYGELSDFPVTRMGRDVRVRQADEGACDIQRRLIDHAVGDVRVPCFI